MSVFTDLKDKLGEFFNVLMRDQRKANLQELLTASANWQPSGEFFTYKNEMQARQDYYLGSMQSDMREVLKRHFPQTYTEVERDQVNLPLVKKEISDKAQVFVDSGDVVLVNDSGEIQKIESFEEMKRKSNIWSALKDADAYTQLQHRSMFKPWWDSRAGHARCSVWPAQLVDIVPDPFRWWDVDSAWAVLFTLPGISGINSSSYRYEVWGYRDQDAVDAGMDNTVYFTTDGNNDYRINDEDVNPFTDPRTGGSLYPFVWWQDDTITSLYVIGDEDLLTVNRQVNSILTDANYTIRFNSIPAWVHTMAEGGSELGVKTISPGCVIDIPAGAGLDPKTPTLNITEIWNYTKELMEIRALFGGLSPSAVRADSSAPESGYALKIRNKPIREHRQNLVEIYRPYVEESVYRLCVVHNTYADDKIPIEGLRVKWEPGEIDEIEDPMAVGNQYAAEIEANVSTAADWRAARYDETREEARKAVEKNAEENREQKSKGKQELPTGYADAFAQRMGLKKPEEEGTDEE
ncbi:MAG: hypothetical protein JRH07_14055 [Deltaproteobacteria bacterium]|nr:hypothetical protein [Deltaproteobacteria bacterium]